MILLSATSSSWPKSRRRRRPRPTEAGWTSPSSVFWPPLPSLSSVMELSPWSILPFTFSFDRLHVEQQRSPLSSSPLFPPTWTTSPNSGSSERSRGLSHSRVRSRCCLHHSGPDKIIVLTIIIIILLMITVIIISLIAMIFTMMKNAVNGHWSGSMRGFLQVRLWRLDGLDHQHDHHCHQHHYHHHCCLKSIVT